MLGQKKRQDDGTSVENTPGPSHHKHKQVTMASVVKQAHALYQFGFGTPHCGSQGDIPEGDNKHREEDMHHSSIDRSFPHSIRQSLVQLMAWQAFGGEVAVRNWLILVGYCLAPASGHIIFALALSLSPYTFPAALTSSTPQSYAFLHNGWLPSVLFSVWALCYGVSALGWAVASRRVQVKKLFCAGLVGQALSLLMMASAAVGLHFLYGSSTTASSSLPAYLLLMCLILLSTVHSFFAASGFPIFVGFNFIDMPEGSLPSSARRAAVGESLKHLISYALLDLIIFTAITGTGGKGNSGCNRTYTCTCGLYRAPLCVS
mmetsp:Transcript_9189/g.22519  ORF Transcript_9189/g.22519 Transcript_9189/m.22519 type:complete len:318 (-) Transcript_9189:320-1273(-)